MRSSTIGIWLGGLLPLFVWAANDSPSTPEPIVSAPLIRIERTPVTGGGELRTYFGRLPDYRGGGTEIPLVSILTDTLGDPDPANDRVRYVYAFGYSRPTLWQRTSAAVPFLYRRAGGDRRRTVEPTPLLDMAHPAKGTWQKLAGAGVQSAALDPLGALLRTSSRSYRSRTTEYREMHVNRALDALESAPDATGFDTSEIRGRLVLSTKVLGGLVSADKAPSAWIKRRNASAMNRGHNWELLRQRAEANGLVFEPLNLGTEEANFALLWIRADEPEQPFDGRFLSIANPYGDDRIRNWNGYSETWYVNPEGERVEAEEPGACAARMIPLALYALDHPKVPLLMIDFRAPGKMKRREMALRLTDDLTTGVLGLTGWGNLPYAAGKSAFFFVRGRWGAPVNRAARVRAYVHFREALLMDGSLAPALRAELERNLERAGWNPFEEDMERQVQVANAQYVALLERAQGDLKRDLDRQRAAEIRAEIHSRRARLGLRAATLASFGIYRHNEPMTPARMSAVDLARRENFEQRALKSMAALPPLPAPVSHGGGQ